MTDIKGSLEKIHIARLLLFPILLLNHSAEVMANSDFDDLSLDSLLNLQVVTASRKAESLKDAPSNISVITQDQIENWGARSLDDVMRRIAGFTVVHDRDEIVYASRGNVSDNNSKYLILIDGHNLNSTENFGPANIGRLPNDLSNIKRIEIIKGPGSMIWGASALAGVINLISKDANDLDDKAHVSAYVGQDSTEGFNFQVGLAESDDADIILMGAFSGSDGREIQQSRITGLPDIVDESGNAADAVDATGRPTKYTTKLNDVKPSYMLHMKARIGDFKLSAYTFDNAIFNGHFESDRGRENYLTNHKVFIEGRKYTELSDTSSTEWYVAYHNNDEAYEPFVQGTVSEKLPPVITWEDTRYEAGISYSSQATENLTMDYALMYTHTEHGPNYRINSFNADEPDVIGKGFLLDNHLVEDQVGGYITGNWSLDNWRLIVGTWVDYNNERGSDATNVSPRIAAIWDANDNSVWKWIYNRAFLRSTNNQSTNNPNVDSEIMDQVEMINIRQWGKSSLTSTLYSQKLSGFINIVSIVDENLFENAGDYSSTGFEFEYNHQISNQSEFWATLSYADTEGENFNSGIKPDAIRTYTDGSLLSYPKIKCNLGGTFFLNDNFQVSPALRYLGDTNYRAIAATAGTIDDESIYDEIGAVFYLDITSTWFVRENSEFSINVFNLLDEGQDNHLTVWNGELGAYGRYAQAKLSINF